ncbi:succinate dehydrogenase, hydrophobic membrane anchor protein [Chitinilyticum aquatile]|uniref:succinate dehydrogenase, hydrophobic membrane anchor protein n=1 Tax=Chitinilyticum aquatile TaxID=362520 RepID=UPI00040A912E|nr:succinate dehydrogenase, hydrophobic membrane anchor protein [Chitinilyticum aquatile]
MVNRIVVGAHYGLRDWLVQRATAVIMLVYAVAVGAFVLFAAKAGYADWQQLFSCTWVKVLTTVTVLALLWHAWVGIRDIWMDYVQPLGLRVTLHVLTIVWLVGSLVYSVKVVWGV